MMKAFDAAKISKHFSVVTKMQKRLRDVKLNIATIKPDQVKLDMVLMEYIEIISDDVLN